MPFLRLLYSEPIQSVQESVQKEAILIPADSDREIDSESYVHILLCERIASARIIIDIYFLISNFSFNHFMDHNSVSESSLNKHTLSD